MSLRSFMLGSLGPYTYDPTLDYRDETPISDYTSAGAISFVARAENASPKITDPSSGFITAGFYPNAVIEIRGSSGNDGYALVIEVEAGTITLHDDAVLTAETAGAGAVTISTPVQSGIRGLDAFLGSSGEDTISDSDDDTKVQCEESADEDIIRFDAAGTQEAQIDANGLTLKTGASVNELSTDGALAGDSDDAVPTEKAVKLYVDTHEADTTAIHGIVDTSKLNTSDAIITDHALVRGDGGAQKIQDSNITVDDDGRISMNTTSRIAWNKITANNITQGNGNHGAFDVTHIQTAYDGNIYQIIEAAADPGFELTVEFISVTAFNWVQLHASYEGRVTHSVQISLYNFNTTTWDCYGAFSPSMPEVATAGEYTLENKSFFVPDDSSYIGTGDDDGDVRVRIRHTIGGNPADDIHIGVVALYR